MYKIGKIIRFSAAHSLPWLVDSPCRHLHGHNYTVELVLESCELDIHGMVQDFFTLSDVETIVQEKLDHTFLNEIIHNSTAENIAKYIFDCAIRNHPNLVSVKVWETDDCWGEYTK